VRRLEPTLLLAALASLSACEIRPEHPALAIATGDVAAPAPAQQCTAAEHRQFDFWVGTWTVTTPDGRPAGTNRIEAVLGGCALVERWSGAGGSHGTSLNYWDPAERAWFQSWIDDQGQPLRIRGGMRDGRMVLEGESADSGRVLVQRITWTPLDGDRLRQHWERSADGGRTWTTLFDGLYTREAASSPDGGT
jgi:hypothetical protein